MGVYKSSISDYEKFKASIDVRESEIYAFGFSNNLNLAIASFKNIDKDENKKSNFMTVIKSLDDNCGKYFRGHKEQLQHETNAIFTLAILVNKYPEEIKKYSKENIGLVCEYITYIDESWYNEMLAIFSSDEVLTDIRKKSKENLIDIDNMMLLWEDENSKFVSDWHNKEEIDKFNQDFDRLIVNTSIDDLRKRYISLSDIVEGLDEEIKNII